MLGVLLPEAIREQVLPALAAVDCYAARRGGSLRIAPRLHSTPADVERLIHALASAVHA